MSTTLILASALIVSGEIPEPSAIERARELLAALPKDPHTRVGRGATLLAALRQRPDIVCTLVNGGSIDRWDTLAALADAGATVDELLRVLSGKEGAREHAA